MKLTQCKVTEIRSNKGIYKLGSPVLIHDEGSYYRIGSTYIYDKCKIKSTQFEDEKIVLHMVDDDITLTVLEKK